MPAILYYFHDPMCSWCYAFQPIWQEIKTALHSSVEVRNVLGGLAADDDEPMAASLQHTIKHHWQRIQQAVPGTKFNFEFWSACKPRRSTYPACRAVIAAVNQKQAIEDAMIEAIQRAYYLEARNPSDYLTHVELAEELQLDVARFKKDLTSAETDQELMRQIALTRSFNVPGFPGLVLALGNRQHVIPIDYINAESTLKVINGLYKVTNFHNESK